MSSLTPRVDKLEANLIINGAFDFWQRGTSFTSGNPQIYTSDRWVFGRDAFTAASTATRQSGPTNGSTYCLRMQRNDGTSSTARMYVFQMIELEIAKRLAGQTVQLSFKARRSSGFSGTTFRAKVVTGNSATQQTTSTYFNSGITGMANTTNEFTITSTSSFDTYSMSAIVPAGTTHVVIDFSYLPSGTAATDYVEFTDVMLNVGDVAAPFVYFNKTLAGELISCQRYYEKSYNLDTAPGTATGPSRPGGLGSIARPDNNVFAVNPFKVTKRAIPTVVFWDTDIASTTIGTPNQIGANGAMFGGSFIGSVAWHFTADAEL